MGGSAGWCTPPRSWRRCGGREGWRWRRCRCNYFCTCSRGTSCIQYLVHEAALFAGAVAIGALVLLDWLGKRLPAAVQRGVLPLAALLLGLHLAVGSPMLKAASLSVGAADP